MSNNKQGIESFEDFFKSEVPHAECSNCGADITEDISKAMKGSKGGFPAAKKVGNQMEPHKGGKTGSQVNHPRGGKKGAKVDRDATGHKVGTVVMGKSEGDAEMLAPFPNGPARRVSEWVGQDADAALASNIEAAQRGEPNDLHIPSQRNPRLERDPEMSRVEE